MSTFTRQLNCFDLIARAVDLYAMRDSYAYFYGAKGQVLTDSVMETLWMCEPEYFSRYSAAEKEQIFDYSRMKTGIDCSGYINLIVCAHKPSYVYYSEGVNKTTPQAGTWGNMLFTTFGGTGRHIGIDIGQGRFLHIPKELHTIELGIIKDYPWEHSAQFKGISYLLTGDR